VREYREPINTGSIILDDPSQIATFYLLQLRSALKLDIMGRPNGMVFSNRADIARVIVDRGVTSIKVQPKRMTMETRKKLYRELDALIVECGGMSRPLPKDA
jgi:hypothetical protein